MILHLTGFNAKPWTASDKSHHDTRHKRATTSQKNVNHHNSKVELIKALANLQDDQQHQHLLRPLISHLQQQVDPSSSVDPSSHHSQHIHKHSSQKKHHQQQHHKSPKIKSSIAHRFFRHQSNAQ